MVPEWELGLATVAYLGVGVIIGIGLVLTGLFPTIKAAPVTWTQTDWSGGAASGVVLGDVNTYESASAVNTAVSGSLSLQTLSGWMDANWRYRIPLGITNNTGVPLTNYQVPLNINTQTLIAAGKLNADCSDIRVANDVGGAVPYWIETGAKGCGTASTNIWVKLPLVPVGNTGVYIYYGNPIATSTENGNEVFEFFDDFADGAINITKWLEATICSAVGTNFVESGGNLTGGNNCRYLRSLVSFTGDYIAETRIYENSSAVNGFTSIGFWSASANGWGILIHNGTTYIRNNANWPNIGSFSRQKWTRDYVRVVGTNAYASRVAEDGSEERTYSAVNPGGISGEYVTLSIRYDVGTYNQNYAAAWDWIFVRKAASTDPVVSVTGSEELRYQSSGSLTSNVLDTHFPSDWGTLNFTTSLEGSVAVKVRSGNTADMSDASAWASCAGISSGTDISTSGCVTDSHRYIQYQVGLSRSGADTPVFETISIVHESSDLIPPETNATNVSLVGVLDGSWTKTNPEITWDEGEDNDGGTGIFGYCIALDEANIGSPNSLDPKVTAGKLAGIDDGVAQAYCPYIVTGTSVDLSAIGGLVLTSGKQYYFSIKAVDVPGNVWTGAASEYRELVSFKFDNTPPPQTQDSYHYPVISSLAKILHLPGLQVDQMHQETHILAWQECNTG